MRTEKKYHFKTFIENKNKKKVPLFDIYRDKLTSNY